MFKNLLNYTSYMVNVSDRYLKITLLTICHVNNNAFQFNIKQWHIWKCDIEDIKNKKQLGRPLNVLTYDKELDLLKGLNVITGR